MDTFPPVAARLHVIDKEGEHKLFMLNSEAEPVAGDVQLLLNIVLVLLTSL